MNNMMNQIAQGTKKDVAATVPKIVAASIKIRKIILPLVFVKVSFICAPQNNMRTVYHIFEKDFNGLTYYFFIAKDVLSATITASAVFTRSGIIKGVTHHERAVA